MDALQQLHSGRPYVIRTIRPSDKPLLRWGLRQASVESVHKRFLGPKPRLSRAELAYLTEVDMVDHVALVAVDARRRDVLLGVARRIRDAGDHSAAEMAIIICDDAQAQGLGTALAGALAAMALARGVERFTGTMLAENRAAHRLFARISTAPLRVRHDGPYLAVVAQLMPAPAAPPPLDRPAAVAA